MAKAVTGSRVHDWVANWDVLAVRGFRQVDPATIGAVLTAIARGVAEGLGGQLRAGVRTARNPACALHGLTRPLPVSLHLRRILCW